MEDASSAAIPLSRFHIIERTMYELKYLILVMFMTADIKLITARKISQFFAPLTLRKFSVPVLRLTQTDLANLWIFL